MDRLDEKISKEINKGRFRVFLGNSLNNMIRFSTLGLILCVVLIIASKFIPIYKPYDKSLWIVLGFVMISIFYSIVKYPGNIDSALKIDSLGLCERVVTAAELRGNSSPFAIMQKKDALENLKRVDYREISLRPKKKNIKVLILMSVVMICTVFLPVPLEDKATDLYNTKVAKKQEVKKVEKLKKEIDKNMKLEEWEKKTVNYNLSKLQEELKKASNKEELKKSIQRADKKLEMVKNQYNNENLNKVANTLMKNKDTKELGKALKNGDKEALKKHIQEVSKKLKNLTPEERNQLAKKYKELSKEIKENPSLAKAMGDLAQSMAKGELGDISSDMGKLSKEISKLMENEDFKEAVENVKKSLSKSIGSESISDESSNSEDSDGEDGESSGGKGGSQNEKGQGSGSGAGSGSRKGEESTEGSQSRKSGGISKKNGNNGEKLMEYEKVFTSKTLGGTGKQSNIKGKKNSSGTSQQIKTEKGTTLRGESLPYNEVVGEYKNKAMESIDSSTIPEGMKEIVKSYFSSLEN